MALLLRFKADILYQALEHAVQFSGVPGNLGERPGQRLHLPLKFGQVAAGIVSDVPHFPKKILVWTPGVGMDFPRHNSPPRNAGAKRNGAWPRLAREGEDVFVRHATRVQGERPNAGLTELYLARRGRKRTEPGVG